MRLNKYISNSGYTSRRKADELVFDKKVTVNGVIVTEPGMQIDPEKDMIEIDHVKISLEQPLIYIMLNKPPKFVSTVKDQFERPSVIDLIGLDQRIYPVGRLDYDSQGLLLLTNDGDITYKLTHPRHNVSKTYIAKIDRIVDETTLQKIRNGVYIDNYRTRPCQVNVVNQSDNFSEIRVSIMEGRNRQIRKMFEKFGYNIVALERIAIGDISIGNLPLGKWRYLTEKEIGYLKNV
ncbi:MAG: rRNA pseudouridine synthase [Tissierellales bacterium]|nr:rRNA pseudouridine synthase [Tissierellales bacterium]MBN2826902.1 rRNA pseudouridine synthase [Tissierellales bacterium]